MEFISIISIIGTVIGLLAVCIIALKHKRNRYQKFLFLVFIFSLTYNAFLTFLVTSGLLLNYPHFYRTASPFIYCIPISLYLLAKAIGKNQDAPTRSDYALFLIPLLHLIELTPFYFQNSAFKLEHLGNLTANPNIMVFDKVSLISSHWHYLFQFSLGAILMTITFLKTLKYRQNPRGNSRKRKLIWINRISLFLGTCFAILVLLLLIDPENLNIYTYGAFLINLALLIVFLGLFLEPHVLYGTFHSGNLKVRLPAKGGTTGSLSDQDLAFRALIENFFETEVTYLEPSFRQADLATHLNLSRNALSAMINSSFKMNFNELLNEKRIDYTLKNLEDTKWEHLSLEGIAREVGFKSRTTFNKAFKLKTGCTPSKYRTTQILE
ncbi:helix-turn-helix domain-containing protein [Robiginitalea sp.]|uniref:helix-turn-helix domain-containing protein n=1 Tax=Robiginitalea sp. TaxID=1902411 RepID=UPI003C77B011